MAQLLICLRNENNNDMSCFHYPDVYQLYKQIKKTKYFL